MRVEAQAHMLACLHDACTGRHHICLRSISFTQRGAGLPLASSALCGTSILRRVALAAQPTPRSTQSVRLRRVPAALQSQDSTD